MTADEYLYDTEETTRRRELAYGILREPPAPFFSHQVVVLKVARLWTAHVEPRNLGSVAVSPVDVVLDVCGSLILVNHRSGSSRFAHLSAIEYPSGWSKGIQTPEAIYRQRVAGNLCRFCWAIASSQTQSRTEIMKNG